MKNLIIIGAGDFGREVVWLVEQINAEKPSYNIVGFLDDDDGKIGHDFNGYTCIAKVSDLAMISEKYDAYAVIANQTGDIRKKIVDMFPSYDRWETLIHPNVRISETSSVGKGTIICALGNISCNTVIGDFCLFNISVTIGHDCIIGNYVSIMSGSCISGHVQISDAAYLATNCTVIPGMKIGDHAKVGAGSVVIRNVKDSVTVMGVPAVKIKF